MDIIHVSSEMAPIAKVGGLADVVHGLPRELIVKGHRVLVILPKYDVLNLNGIEKLELLQPDFLCFFDGAYYSNSIWRGSVEGIPLVLIEDHHPKQYFNRGKIYACEDDSERYLYFCKVVVEYIATFEKKPDILHLHDWHTATLAGLVKEKFPTLKARTVLTIHNLHYQGITEGSCLEKIEFKHPRLKEGDHYNLLKGGISFADSLTTVSPTYAKEILHTDLGGSLKTALRRREKNFSGILNGIDYTYWNPEKDSFLPENYSISNWKSKKAAIKSQLRKRFFLAEEEGPLVSAITRLVPQKGLEMMKAAMLRTLECGGQFLLLGSSYESGEAHKEFYNLKRKLTGSRHIHLELAYNEELSHLVYAASDLFLVPSIFEPCGLTQMISMHYGTPPLVRNTGGLADTVFEEKNGFCFETPSREGIIEALDRAMVLWYEDPKKWECLVETGMKTDFSWNKPAEEYVKIYKACLKISS